MPPKKPAAEPTLSDDDAPVEETTETKPDAVAVRKLSTHPSTAIMVKEALQELDSRKGVSSQAIQNYIKQKYPSVDLVRLKNLVRKALKKGLETGTLVRPANSTATGLAGRFRVAPKAKEPKAKTENRDPNVPKAPKPAKDGAKKAAGRKKKDSEQAQSEEDPKPPKKSKKSEEAAKKAPAKKTKAKKAAEKSDDEGGSTTKTKATEKSDDEGGSKTKTKATEKSDDEGGSKTKTKATEKSDDEGGSKTKTKATEKSDDEGGSKTKTKATKKSTTKAAKAAKPSKSKAAKAGSDAPAPRATGRRGKSAE